MDWKLQNDELLRNYLLGDLPEDEVDRLERQLLKDDELFKLGEAIEAELLAAYARGELDAAQGERVLHRLASSAAGQARLALARSLNTAASNPQTVPAPVVPLRRAAPAPRPVIRWAALAAGILIAVVGALWLAPQAVRQSGVRSKIADNISIPVKQNAPIPRSQDVEKTLPQPDHSTQQNERASTKPTAEAKPPFVIALSLATLRGAEEIEKFPIPAGTSTVEIQLDLEGLEDLKSFHAAVRSKDRGTVWEKGGLAPKRLKWGSALVLKIPAEDLPSGRYEVAVDAGTEELIHPFEVVRETR